MGYHIQIYDRSMMCTCLMIRKRSHSSGNIRGAFEEAFIDILERLKNWMVVVLYLMF
jgi:hypothetical protein